jgi:hypothetical protein
VKASGNFVADIALLAIPTEYNSHQTRLTAEISKISELRRANSVLVSETSPSNARECLVA